MYTHRFSPKPYQYFEAGAMRLPYIEAHQPMFTLIEYLNKKTPPTSSICLQRQTEFMSMGPSRRMAV